MSLSGCRLAARPGRLPLVCLLGLSLAAAAILLWPAFALALISGDQGGCLCQNPQPPGGSLTVVALLDACHGWRGGGPALLSAGRHAEALTGGAPLPQGCAWPIASVGRPPPLGD